MAAGRVPGRYIDDDESLTQHGTHRADGTFNFRTSLRHDRAPVEQSMSLLCGALDPGAAATARHGNPPRPRDAARLTTAGTLRAEGFRVEHTPRLPSSPLHVSVYWDGEWDDEVANKFDSCFESPRGGRDG